VSRGAVVEWNPRAVFDAVAAQVTKNMETAAKAVELDARHRLLRVREPEFGIKYRLVLALYRLTSGVQQEGAGIEARIGIPRGRKGGDYGFWIETGSRTAPAHPWLRPALLANLRVILQLLEGK